MENVLSILMVDDHPLTLMGLRHTLENAQLPFSTLKIWEAHSIEEALSLKHSILPDVAIVDLQLEDGQGQTLTPYLRENYPDIKILYYSGTCQAYSYQALQTEGVRGFLSKNASPVEFLQAVMSIYYGGYYLGQPFSNSPISHITSAETHPLSTRERQVLQMLAEDYSKEQIALQLNISVRTVETYRARLMKKLGLHSTVSLVRYALAQGLVPLTVQ